ncbi:cyclin-dependent kinase inhibitor 3 family protein [Psychromonas sp. Urea-02u-13]|uniref:cyclin-dependent kinase inhibitor 3 family protein n=1 Tax=Psychromonas sp. Urea-02u-13 TaxID=2058326 RepID=UPI000C34FB6F|nr:cyclin-dependent kinase inhibitor 3 family protein [Psychromonas sp. Urea-02u-13]PKG40123.1 protein phosphatase [Psychromonas sp. Urea-02u-13]
MSVHPLFTLAIKNSDAKIILTPCPGTKEADLTTSLNEIKAAGAQAILTFMTQAELDKNNLSDIGESIKAKGMSWFHLPIVDDEAPEAPFSSEWKTAGPAIHRLIEQGKSIAVHCKGGSGRTGLISAQILLERGEKIEPLMKRIQRLRPNAFTHACHRDYLHNLASKL